MESLGLISVIVPAYNVENYITDCIQSILNQDYNSFEIIIVDDGSTDKTPAILDQLGLLDCRIKVIHKNNSGVSSARNKGLDMAQGEYVAFVDADDFLAQDYLSYMLEMATSTGADYCISTECFMSRNDDQTSNLEVKTISSEDATVLLLSPKMRVGCWNKFYKRDLLLKYNIRFNEELFFGEGLCFITTVSQRAEKVAIENKKVYYYRRDNDDSATTSFSIARIYNGIKSLNEIETNLILRTPQVYLALELHNVMYRKMAATKIYLGGMCKLYHEDYKSYVSYVRKHISRLLWKNGVPLYNKILLATFSISPKFASMFSKVRSNRSKSHSVR